MSSYQLRIHPFAEFDMQYARKWYNAESENLGNEFMNEVQTTISQILNNPNRFPEIVPNTRRAVVSRFPYSIFYKIELETIDLYSVFHNSRNPIIWKNKIE